MFEGEVVVRMNESGGRQEAEDRSRGRDEENFSQSTDSIRFTRTVSPCFLVGPPLPPFPPWPCSPPHARPKAAAARPLSSRCHSVIIKGRRIMNASMSYNVPPSLPPSLPAQTKDA